MAAEIEWDPLAYAVKAEASKTGGDRAGPDLSREMCACGKFGPWGESGIFYCEEHVPGHLRFAGQFFKEMYE